MNDLETKVLEKIKNELGDLLTDADISKLVEKSIQQVFFQKITKSTGYHNTTSEPLINQLILESLGPMFKTCIDDWITSNGELVKSTLQQVISDGAGMAIINTMNNKFSSSMSAMQYNIEQQISNNQ